MNYYQTLLLCHSALSFIMFLVFFIRFLFVCTAHLYVRPDFPIGDVAAPTVSKFKKEFNQTQTQFF